MRSDGMSETSSKHEPTAACLADGGSKRHDGDLARRWRGRPWQGLLAHPDHRLPEDHRVEDSPGGQPEKHETGGDLGELELAHGTRIGLADLASVVDEGLDPGVTADRDAEQDHLAGQKERSL